MPPFVSMSSYVSIPDTPHLEPQRLVLVPLRCFYCGHAEHDEIGDYTGEWRIFHLFGLFHCSAHEAAAERDCKEYMRSHGIVRLCDARAHATLGPFLTALGNTIPVLRSSGTVDVDWHIPYLDEMPVIRRSNSTGEWGLNLTNPTSTKFVPLSQFRDSRVAPHLSDEAWNLLDAVESLLVQGFYGEA